MKITRYMVAAAVGFLCLVAPSVVRADSVVYSNFGPGDTFANGGFTVGVPGINESLAGSFTGTGLPLAEVDLPLAYISGTNSVVVDLLGDSGGVPNTSNLLEQWTVNNIPSAGQIFDLASTSNPFLASGTQYWLAAFPGASDTSAGWFVNSIGVNGGYDVSTDAGTSWFPAAAATPAFRILAVPEPSSLLLLGTGLVGLVAAMCRKRLA